MSKHRSLYAFLFVLVTACILAVLFSIWIGKMKTNRPRVTVNYVDEYNRITKPPNFDANDNAAPYFEKAYELMVDEHNDIRNLLKIWPADMNANQLQTAKQLVESNRQALDYIKQGISRTYYWKPVEADDNELLMALDSNELSRFRKATYLLCLEARMMVQQGQIEPSLRQLVDVYKLGTFFAGPKSLIDQLVGIAVSALAVNSALETFDRTRPPQGLLQDFQQRITCLSSSKPFLTNFAGERLILADEIQRRFVCYTPANVFEDPLYLKRIWLRKIWGPMERRKADRMYDYLGTEAHKTPWELHSGGVNVDKAAEEITKGSVLVRILTPACAKVILISYRIQVHTDGLIATIAILRYKGDTGRYPENLQELVAAGYLDKLPMDVFSGKPLVYKLSGDGFQLYSFAQDFDDDGGRHDPKWANKGDGDYVFWPVQEPGERVQKESAADATERKTRE